MGQMLNAFFASVFTTECVEELPYCKNIFQGNDESKLRNYHISPSMVKAKLLKLKMNKAPGVENYGHFGPKTLRTLDTSALVWWVRTVRTDRHWCRSVLKTVRT